MIRILFVGDGKRDAVTVPRIVEHILGEEVNEETSPWPRLHTNGGRGYEQKLKYANRKARFLQVAGLVATLDTDKARKGSRLAKLRAARDADREASPPIPTALGEATPHGEAWLLDDPVAVREALKLARDAIIPSVTRTRDPKGAIEKLIDASDRASDPPMDVLADIARRLNPKRCIQKSKTGFAGLVEEVSEELGPLTQ